MNTHREMVTEQFIKHAAARGIVPGVVTQLEGYDPMVVPPIDRWTSAGWPNNSVWCQGIDTRGPWLKLKDKWTTVISPKQDLDCLADYDCVTCDLQMRQSIITIAKQGGIKCDHADRLNSEFTTKGLRFTEFELRVVVQSTNQTLTPNQFISKLLNTIKRDSTPVNVLIGSKIATLHPRQYVELPKGNYDKQQLLELHQLVNRL